MELTLLLVLTVTVVAAASDTPCKCNSDVDNKDFWAHLVSISKDIDATKDKAAYAVLPAVLSPLVDCDCAEKNRPKRKSAKTIPATIVKPHPKVIAGNKMTPVRHGGRICPKNFVKVGKMCVPEGAELE